MIRILGAGLAGTSAAIRALQRGQPVELIERGQLPRHKVCGEFLSPEAAPILESLGVPVPEAAAIRRVQLHFARSSKSFPLPEAALGVSRYLLDRRMLERAMASGATVVRQAPTPLIVANGRQGCAARGNRLFAFKSHFRGPVHDAVELYFLRGGYVGVNPVEGGLTNVCGLLPESELLATRFDPEPWIAEFQPLRDRLASLERTLPWLRVGPLVFHKQTNRPQSQYVAGDALIFVDPFTGSGMLSALLTGGLAGECAAQGIAVDRYLQLCERRLGSAFRYASVIRKALASPWAERLMPWVPGSVLFQLTRPLASE